MREIILLQCSECKNKNYSTTKNKKNTPDKLQLRKYCKHCRRHTLHKETKA
ncbi:MAG: 50S ribosomal protein L33 [Deltaproteobacteria bacterium]|nr:50S ribosomal protein L33 [Thermodesulfovibrio sp.]MDW8003159.1 50S ribosomal protein L33 [Deltaproteobacteria bacterium]